MKDHSQDIHNNGINHVVFTIGHYFFDTISFGSEIFLYKQTFYFDPKIFLMPFFGFEFFLQIFFHDPKLFLKNLFFWLKIFLTQKVYGPEIFLTQDGFWTQHFCIQHLFILNFFLPWISLKLNFWCGNSSQGAILFFASWQDFFHHQNFAKIAWILTTPWLVMCDFWQCRFKYYISILYWFISQSFDESRHFFHLTENYFL